MSPLLDLRTIALVYVAVRVGLAVVLAYLWSVQRNYPPARDWAIGAGLTAAGLFLMALRHLVSSGISEILSNALLFPGWMIFDFGIIKACGRQPPQKLGLALCGLALFGMIWYGYVQPSDPGQTLVHHLLLILFDLASIHACLSSDSRSRRQTFRAIAFLQLISVAIFLLKLGEEVFGLLGPLPPHAPQIMLLIGSVTIFPMLTMLLSLQTSQKLQEELNDQARLDMLTGAYNRRALSEFIDRAWGRRQQQPLSVLSLDIDNFKAFNDRYGHQTGDQALVLVSRVAQTTLRQADIWCRHGGEEFVALLPDTDLQQARASAERIRQAVAQSQLASPQGGLTLTVSIGVAQRRPQHAHWNELLAISDAALYQAKAAGKNCVMTGGEENA
ncbi:MULTISPECIES: GGDEF domain-containing protein [unclassified Paludibacterium]|uniref:GGDEF domain-containing protein n=1 Tax=unclassified Paludibacterium TaxID=2618429 RepID=UPI001C054F94|nr:GGDEF domain-containing protein [Paludibacterium sp. B53371]BEV72598.1 hypothetical protein THUN1379_20800 [Paludibacterium sp. THUN1379]